MPATFTNIVAGAAQFTGATVNDGLFTPTDVGAGRQVVIHALTMNIDGAVPTITIRKVDPDNAGNDPLFYTGDFNDLDIEGFTLPVNANGNSWSLVVTTSGKTGDGSLSIDWGTIRNQ